MKSGLFCLYAKESTPRILARCGEYLLYVL